MFHAPDPVASGRGYAVRAVDGALPTRLQDFTGPRVMVVCGAGEDPSTVAGEGLLQSDQVRFLEKDLLCGGKDVRPWLVAADVEGGFTATPDTR